MWQRSLKWMDEDYLRADALWCRNSNRLIVLKFSLSSSNIKTLPSTCSSSTVVHARDYPSSNSYWTPHLTLRTFSFYCNRSIRVSDWDACVTSSSFISAEGFLHHCVCVLDSSPEEKKMQMKCSNILRPLRQVAARSHLLVVSGLLQFPWSEHSTDVRSEALSLVLSVWHEDSFLIFSVLGVLYCTTANQSQLSQPARNCSAQCFIVFLL